MPKEKKAKKVIHERWLGSAGRGCHSQQSGQKRPEWQVFEQVSTNTRGRQEKSYEYLGKEHSRQREQYTEGGGCPFYGGIARTVAE